MGIQGLMKVINDHAPGSIKENVIKNYFGRKICIDASMSLYQFLIAVRPDDTNSFTLTNDVGETTSHLIGFFYRTIRMVESGIKPVYVFDGKPPTLKSGELAKRTKKRKEAEEAVTEAKEEGDKEALAKANKRTQRVTPQHNEEAKKLLSLMGIPYVDAPCEAEAQCAAMVKAGMCYGAGSEDMDSLTLATPLLIRHLNYSESRGLPILEIRLEKVLEGLNMTMDEFIDLCILLGCDYCDSIRGIGPVRALQLIEKHKNLETILETLDPEKYKIPENFPFVEIRELFKHPEVADPATLDIKWTAPNEEGLIEFLVQQKGFSEDRVRRGIEKLNKCRSAAVQDRITSFFNVAPKTETKPAPKKEPVKKTAGAKKVAAKVEAKTEPKAESSSAHSAPHAPFFASSQDSSTKSTTEVKTEETSEAPKVEEKKAPIHPFFQPRKAKPVAATTTTTTTTTIKSEKSPASSQETKMHVTEVPQRRAESTVRKGRIIEDDGDE